MESEKQVIIHEKIPKELMIQIFLALPVEMVDTLWRVCKHWWKICKDESLWKLRVQKDFPSDVKEDSNQKWIDFYYTTFRLVKLIFKFLFN